MPHNLDAITAPLAAMLAAPPDPRSVPVRFSTLKHIDRSPAHYLDAIQRPSGEQTISMRLGSGVHAMVFDQPVSRYPGRRVGEKWEEFKAAHAGHVILNAAEWTDAERVAQSIKLHPAAMSALFASGARIEEPIAWMYNGRACSSRPDSFSPAAVVDLKTTRNAAPSFFVREALRMHYHVQLAAYRAAIEHACGYTPDRGMIVCVETEPPHAVAVYEVSPRALDQGLATWARWFDRLLVCEAANQWPAYGEAAIVLDVPEDPFTTWSEA